MPLRYWIRIVELIFVAALALALFDSWRADRRDRDSQLAETLKSLAAEKRTVVTPAQIANQLPREIGLPSPILLRTGTFIGWRANTIQQIGLRKGIARGQRQTHAAASHHPRRRSKASLRFHHRLQSRPGKARHRTERPHRRAQKNRRAHARTRRRPDREGRHRLAPHPARCQMVFHWCCCRRRCRKGRSLIRFSQFLHNS
jgi:hypothetical protein